MTWGGKDDVDAEEEDRSYAVGSGANPFSPAQFELLTYTVSQSCTSTHMLTAVTSKLPSVFISGNALVAEVPTRARITVCISARHNFHGHPHEPSSAFLAGSFACVAFRHDWSPCASGNLKEIKLQCHCVLCMGGGLKQWWHEGRQSIAGLAEACLRSHSRLRGDQ